MIRRWLERRRKRRTCPHPRDQQDAWAVDTGMGRIVRCRLCGKRWAV